MPHTILVVDDDPDTLSQMRRHLTQWGFDVRTADSLKQADAALREQRPDLAIVDLMLEDVDSGFTLCHRIKRQDPAIPVILVTAVTHYTNLQFDALGREEAAWIKADAILQKPVLFETLAGRIRQLLPAD